MVDTSSKSSEHRLVERIRGGDERAYEELFQAYYASLCTFATGFVNSYDAARDVVQDVFLNIWQHREQWALHTSVKAYLYQAVRNQSLKQRRGEERRLEREQAVEVPSSALAEEEYRRKELEAAIWKAVGRLPERRREIFVLHRQHGLTYQEIAQVMGTLPKTVENQIGRALKFLRETLPPEYF